jgi:hypothetical protein
MLRHLVINLDRVVHGGWCGLGRVAAFRGRGVEVEFVGWDGVMRREPLGGCWNLAFERVAPVRGFASFRGQRNRPGLWWFSRTGEHVGTSPGWGGIG